MKHSILLCSLLLTAAGTVKAQTTTPITSVDELSETNNKVLYYITTADAARGSLYAPFVDGTSNGELAVAGSTYNMQGYTNYRAVTKSASDVQQQFALITYQNKLYLYCPAAGKFSYKENNTAGLTSEAANINYVTVTSRNANFEIKYNGTSRLTFSNSGGHRNAIFTGNASTDNGNAMIISKIGGSEAGSSLSMSDAQFETAMGILRKITLKELADRGDSLLTAHGETEAGYPNATARGTLQAAISEARAGISATTATTDADLTTMQQAINAYYATTEVNLPADGKAYRIKAKYSNGNFRYIKYDETAGRLNVTAENAEPATDYSDIYICKHIEGNKVALVNPLKGFLIYYADGGKTGRVGNTTGFTAGYAPSGANANEQTAAITLEHKTSKTYQPNNPAITPLDVFGSLSLKVHCASHGGDYYFMGGTTNFHDAGHTATACGTGLSSFFYFEEVDYPACNLPKLNAAAGIEEGKYVTTFSAPFATVVPEGLQAYTVSEQTNGTETVAATKLLAEAGQAIPAGEGVILFGDNTAANADGKVTMTPATTEAIVSIEEGVENRLVGTAGIAATPKPAEGQSLLLGMVDSKVAFYNWNGGNLGMNKAYLHLSGTSAVNALRISFGETTGIGTVETPNAASSLYDLSGRRVNTPVKGGIYIRGGKKVIFK